MTTPAKNYLIAKGFQISQSDAYAVYEFSQSVRLANASHNEMRAMLAPLYRLQTENEQKCRETIEKNYAGFAKFQAPLLTRFAQTGACDDVAGLKNALAYHWGQLMTLNDWINRDCWGAYDAGKLTCRNYAGKGTDISKWPARE
jgi:hypothetical protein